MRKDINELEALVDEMLSYSRLESAAGELVLEQVSINQLLENLLEKLTLNTDKTLNLQIAPQVLWLCDGHFLERALQNLITNAIRYAKQTVVVSVVIIEAQGAEGKQSLRICVEDDGCGKCR